VNRRKEGDLGEIVRENVVAMQAIYAASTLEETRALDVADRLVELWASGVLPVGPRGGRTALGAYERGRLGQAERLAVYRRCFGGHGGDPAVEPNTSFGELWLRFLRSVVAYHRQLTARELLPTRRRASREAVRKAGRDLAANLSLYGFGTAGAAARLQKQLDGSVRVFQTEAVRQTYGARDAWQLVDCVALLELGGARDTVRPRARAQAGATIIRWLANTSGNLGARDPRSLRKSAKPLESPTDRDLVDACAQWLALAAVADDDAEQYSQPAETKLVRPVVRRLLASSPAFAQLPPGERTRIARDTVKVASFIAQRHGRRRAHAPADQTWWELQEVDFPAFVSALVNGVFEAIVDSSVRQMRAYGDLVASATRTLEEFARDSVSDDAGRTWLCVEYPGELGLTFVGRNVGRLTVIAKRPHAALNRVSAGMPLRPPLASLDRRHELQLARRARVKLAHQRQELLATMVLMGINRIVVSKGRVDASSPANGVAKAP
jgi:hypothetical protein